MPYLNWKDAPIEASIARESGDHASPPVTLTLSVRENREALLAELVAELRAIFHSAHSGESAELRLDLPKGWTLFFKCREDGESRLLVAYPELEQWVGTLSLSRSHGQALMERLGSPAAQAGSEAGGGALSVRGLGPVVARVSNFELLFEIGS